MECAGRAKRRRRFGCCEALAQLKAPSPLRSAGALQMVVLTISAPANLRKAVDKAASQRRPARPDRWHFAGLGRSEAVSRQIAGAPAQAA